MLKLMIPKKNNVPKCLMPRAVLQNSFQSSSFEATSVPDKTPVKHKHLLDRDGRYWARLSVPKALRSIVNKSELLESLGPDKTEALRKLKVAVGRMQETLNAARGEQKPKRRPMVPTPPGRALKAG